MAAVTATTALQVEEFVLLRCSLLPDEILEFVFSSVEDVENWTKCIDAGVRGEVIPPDDTGSLAHSDAANFIVKIREAPSLWFEFKLAHEYPREPTAFQVMVRGHDVSRIDQERWHKIVQEKRTQLDGVDFPVFNLISEHLLPLLHAEFEVQSLPATKEESMSSAQLKPPTHAHALLTSHHLKSSQKRRSLHQWSSELGLTGYAKVGNPGIIYCSGVQSDVREFVSRVKDMQWLALRVRFEEPLSLPPPSPTETVSRASWVEFHKVGEVVREMERLGREKYIFDLGIGKGSSG